MKKIEAILQQSKLNEVQAALQEIGVEVMTVSEVRGFGPRNRHVETYRGSQHTVNFLPKIKIDLVVVEQKSEEALQVIVNCARKGKLDDDKVFISDVRDAGCMVAL
jgi:nitrogen regulatory protein PII